MQHPAYQAIQSLCTAVRARIKAYRAVSMGARHETTALYLQPVCDLGEDQHAGSHRLQVSPWHLQHSPCSACGHSATTKCQLKQDDAPDC
jgi:hypothetical protein